MKEADIFENWANRLTEGTWQLPDTPETKQKLADLLVNEVPVGPDAANALEQLDGVLGDDQLYDQLEALAQEDANADARDVIRARMEEMGLEVPGSDADAEVEPGAEPAPVEPQQGVAEDKATYGPVTDAHKAASKKVFAAGVRDGKAGAEKNKQHMASALMKTTYLNGYKQGKQGVAEGSLNEFAPGGGGGESGRWYTDDQMTDIVGDGWWQDLDISGEESKQGMIQEAQAWLLDNGYRVQVLNVKLNDDDCDWFIEGSFQNPGFAKKGMAESSSCNMTMEGDYCPEHGLMECGMHEGLGDWVRKGLDKLNWDSGEANAASDDFETRMKAEWAKYADAARQGDPEAQKKLRDLKAQINFYRTGSRDGMSEGMLGNPGQEDSPAAQAITRRILLQRTDLLSKYGPEKVGQAIDEVADFIGDVEEIGSSDVSGWVRHVEQMLGNMGDDVGEGVDDPINYNGAITGSYYEDKQDPLARLKSLALRK
jgi:hypothetical protein